MINVSGRLGIERKYSSQLGQFTASSFTTSKITGEKLKAIPLNQEQKTKSSTFSKPIQKGTGSLSWSNDTAEECQENTNWKERSQSLFADDMIVYA